jgi:hypothetical protein
VVQTKCLGQPVKCIFDAGKKGRQETAIPGREGPEFWGEIPARGKRRVCACRREEGPTGGLCEARRRRER